MNGAITVIRAASRFNFQNTNPSQFLKQKYRTSRGKKTVPEILFITSFPPRECGIATYSQDLIGALSLQFESSFKCTICALEANSEKYVYMNQPKYKLNTNQYNSFVKTAFKINGDSNTKLIVIQHEFGFFAAQELGFKYLYSHIFIPIIFVFHTVLPQPNEELKAQVMDMASHAKAIVVMTENAAEILINDYLIEPKKIKVIPHGTHLVSLLDREKEKKRYHLSYRKVLSTFGLLSSSKSIETTLDALPFVIKSHPDVLFLILGKTHPSIVKQEGEKYREMLQDKVLELKLQQNVRFVNEYLPLPVLLEYLQLSDIYLFTSKDPNQAVSGTFSYAVSSGCPVISTPIPHALEVLDDSNGIIIDFENATQLSMAINLLLDNKELRQKISSNSFHKMASTAWQNSAIAHALLFKHLIPEEINLSYEVPEINLNHIQNMTTRFGMLQFSKISSPDLNSGYTLDDNARALITLCQNYVLFEDENDLILINAYLQYIKYCLQPNCRFLNYVNEQELFTSVNFSENLEDSNGRAIWALGFVVSLQKTLPLHMTFEAENILQIVLPHLEKIHSTRAMAFIIKGLHFQNKKENMDLIQLFAQRLVQMYKHEKSDDWQWFEGYLTYGNSVLSEALICAYISTNQTEYKEIAVESFDFLLSKIFVDNKIKVISNKGWHMKGSMDTIPTGGEQPIDVAYTIMALEKFYSVCYKDDYKNKIQTAFNWFLGANHLNQIVYNPRTGGCYDGVEEFNVNLNQGAESTLSYALARLAVERVFHSPKVTLIPKTKILEIK